MPDIFRIARVKSSIVTEANSGLEQYCYTDTIAILDYLFSQQIPPGVDATMYHLQLQILAGKAYSESEDFTPLKLYHCLVSEWLTHRDSAKQNVAMLLLALMNYFLNNMSYNRYLLLKFEQHVLQDQPEAKRQTAILILLTLLQFQQKAWVTYSNSILKNFFTNLARDMREFCIEHLLMKLSIVDNDIVQKAVILNVLTTVLLFSKEKHLALVPYLVESNKFCEAAIQAWVLFPLQVGENVSARETTLLPLLLSDDGNIIVLVEKWAIVRLRDIVSQAQKRNRLHSPRANESDENSLALSPKIFSPK